MKHASLFFGLIVALGLLMSNCKPSQEPTSVFAEAESLMYTHPDSALHLLQAIPNPEQLTEQAQADYALLMTQAKSRNRIYATSDSLIRIAVDYYQNSDEMGQKAKTLLYLGDVLMDMERYADATLPLKQAEELMEHVSDRQIQTMIYSNLGYLNREAEDYELALSYYKKALAINRTHQDFERFISNVINIINLPIPEFADSVPNYIQQLLQIIDSTRSDLQEKAYNNIGVYYMNQNQPKKAKVFFNQSIQAAKGINYESYLSLAEIYESEKDIKRADSLYQLALQSPVWATKALVYENIYQRKLKLGQTEEAAHYMNAYIQAVDSFHTHRQANEIQAIQQKYDQEVILRQKDRIEIWLYRIVFSFLILIGILTAFIWYLKKKNKAHLQALQEQIKKITSLYKTGEEKIKNLDKEIIEKESKHQQSLAKATNKNLELKAEIATLNQQLDQSNIIKQTLQLSTLEDIQALEVYIKLLQNPKSYQAKNDFPHLQHWLNLAHNNFATRLVTRYPNLSPTELTLCYLQRIGYSLTQMSIAMEVKEDTIKRNIYRASEHLKIEKDKEKTERTKKFAHFVKSF